MANNTWNIDVSHSAVHFYVRHMVISKVHGRFAKWSGQLEFDPSNPGKASVAVKIDASSIDTQVADRDAHLKSPDFFDVGKFPELSFVSKKVEGSGESLKIHGELTMHGVTKPVVLDAEFSGTGKDPWGNERAGFSAKASLDRRDYGLTWNKALETGGILVGEKVEIAIELEAVKQVAATPVAA
ncbi:MAG: YceI family protein [Myxococcaceae bacterium]